MAEAENPSPPTPTLDTLVDDVLLTVLGHARFRALLAMKRVSSRFTNVARRSLINDARWAIAKREPPATTDFYLALRSDDIDTVEAKLALQSHAGYAVGPVSVPEATNQWAGSAFPLHFAHSAAMVQLLLEFGAIADLKRLNGMSALMDSAAAGEAEVVRELCRGGADVHARDAPDGVTALYYAERSGPFGSWSEGHRGPIKRPDRAACVRALVEFGARAGSFRRQEWYDEDPELLPSEYQVGFH